MPDIEGLVLRQLHGSVISNAFQLTAGEEYHIQVLGGYLHVISVYRVQLSNSKKKIMLVKMKVKNQGQHSEQIDVCFLVNTIQCNMLTSGNLNCSMRLYYS